MASHGRGDRIRKQPGAVERRVGQRIRELRHHLGLTLDGLSAEAGLTLDGLAKIEAGRRTPTITTLLSVAEALGTTVGDLLDEREPTTPPALRALVSVLRNEDRQLQALATGLVRDFVRAVRAGRSGQP